MENAVCLESSITSGSESLSDSSSSRVPDGDTMLDSHSLYIVQLWVSVWVPLSWKRKLLWWWLCRHWTWAQQKSLGVTAIYFSRTLEYSFPLNPWPICSQATGHLDSVDMGSISWNGSYFQSDSNEFLPQLLCQYSTSIPFRQVTTEGCRDWSWVQVCLFNGTMQNTFQCHERWSVGVKAPSREQFNLCTFNELCRY